MKKNISKSFFVTLLSASVCLLLVAPALAVEYGGVGGRPANPRADNPRTESIFVHTVTPGQIVEDGVRVLNNTPETKTLMVYAVDSEVASGGAFACEQRGNEQTSVGTWIEVAKTEVTLDSLTNEVVPFKINIPDSASVGEHNGCIIIQEKKDEAEAAGNGIQLSFRTGLRVALMVPGEVERKLEISGLELSSKDNGDWLITPSVQNLGNVSIDTDVYVDVDYFFGKSLESFGGQYPVLRGEKSTWNFNLAKPFWGGWYKTSLAIEYDSDPEASVGVASGNELTRIDGPSLWFFTMPTLGALVIEIAVLVLLIFILMMVLLRCKRKRWIKNAWIEYEVSEGEDIKGLAQKHKASWKLIVNANKLKPPYTLSAGDKIKVPPVK